MQIWNLVGLSWILIGFFVAKEEKNIINPLTIFFVMWGGIIILSNMHLYGLYVAKNEIYCYINLGMFFYLIGFLCAKSKLTKPIKKLTYTCSNFDQYQLEESRCFIFLFFCLFFLGYKIVKYRLVFFRKGFSLGLIQEATENETMSSSKFMNAISFLFINPMLIALPIAIVSDFYIRRKNKKLLLLCCILCVFRVVVSGGRQAFIQFFFYIFISLSFFKDSIKKRLNKQRTLNRKKMIYVTIIIAFMVLLILTVLRTNAVVKTIYLDFSMQPIMLDIWVAKVNSTGKISYGMMTLMGIIYPLCYIFKNIFNLKRIPPVIQMVYDMRLLTMSEWVHIGPNLVANAYVTCFWYFYLDARILGIVIGMLFFGFISCKSYRKAKKIPDSKNVCSYIFVAMAIFYTFGDFYPSNPYYILGYLYAQKVLFKKKKVHYVKKIY